MKFNILLFLFLLLLNLSCSKKEESSSESVVTPPATTVPKQLLPIDKPSIPNPPQNVPPNFPTAPALDENQILIGNLIWEKSAKSGLISWQKAKSYCEKNAMRIPSLNELKKSYTKLNGKDSVWSNAQDEGDPDSVWILDLGSGNAETTAKAFLNEVRCVKKL